MALESGTYIDDLVITNPLGTDAKNKGDDHFRLVKKVLKNTLPGMTGAAWRVQNKSSGYTVLAGDNMTLINCTAALTLDLTAAATLGNQHMFLAHANGGDITVDPNSSEDINGSSTSLTVADGQTAMIICDATEFYAFFMPQIMSAAALTVLDDATVAAMRVTLVLDTVSQAEAEAGTVTTTRAWTAERVKQAIVALETAQADQAALEAETDEDTYVPPDLVRHNPGVAKAGVKFDNAGNIDGTADGVSSVTDNSTGNWSPQWTTDFSSGDYRIVLAVLSANPEGDNGLFVAAQAVGSCTVEFADAGAAPTESNLTACYVVAYGDFA